MHIMWTTIFGSYSYQLSLNYFYTFNDWNLDFTTEYNENVSTAFIKYNLTLFQEVQFSFCWLLSKSSYISSTQLIQVN